MNQSNRPVRSLVRKFAEEFYMDNEKRPSTKEVISFEKELELCAKLKTIAIPQTTMKRIESTSYAQKLVCEGYTLKNRYGVEFNNHESNVTIQMTASFLKQVSQQFCGYARRNKCIQSNGGMRYRFYP